LPFMQSWTPAMHFLCSALVIMEAAQIQPLIRKGWYIRAS
jgi:hypothetical protein